MTEDEKDRSLHLEGPTTTVPAVRCPCSRRRDPSVYDSMQIAKSLAVLVALGASMLADLGLLLTLVRL